MKRWKMCDLSLQSKFEAGVNLKVLHFQLWLIASSRSPKQKIFHVSLKRLSRSFAIIRPLCCKMDELDVVICSAGVWSLPFPSGAGKRVYFHWELGLTQIPPITRWPHLLPRRRTGGKLYAAQAYCISRSHSLVAVWGWKFSFLFAKDGGNLHAPPSKLS